ncbi:hypothetical protein SAMN05660866_00907 [Maribacter arcticus]|uniref:Uncharacterized protein n=1 Tax=Maribacter arcticus TaxID=561365 RepID=A0A1T5AFG6_9FLAO|nr:hypothetical protein SAMN05660866_00907 [Maribacter arcticus]
MVPYYTIRLKCILNFVVFKKAVSNLWKGSNLNNIKFDVTPILPAKIVQMKKASKVKNS